MLQYAAEKRAELEKKRAKDDAKRAEKERLAKKRLYGVAFVFSCRFLQCNVAGPCYTTTLAGRLVSLVLLVLLQLQGQG
jgi:hypothetical protein